MINYGEKLLASLPPEVRKSVFVGLTDLKSIMWFRVTRTAGGAYVYEKGAETTEVAASLCGLLGLSPEQVNDFDSGGNLPYYAPPRFILHCSFHTSSHLLNPCEPSLSSGGCVSPSHHPPLGPAAPAA